MTQAKYSFYKYSKAKTLQMLNFQSGNREATYLYQNLKIHGN